MKLTKEILLAQIKACYHQPTWFVSLDTSIADITEEEALWKRDEMPNSIFEIVTHLLYYNERYLHHIKGMELPESLQNNDETFSIFEDISWEVLVSRIHAVMSEWITVVEQSDEDQLEAYCEDIMHMANHTIHHTGQIVYIRKLQGSWDEEKGVS
ncbi:DinB family protein [Bacillus spongiae]|uniref:DinB family protein n=1 Tax=Bacillus spongiae TaxID=2683610 RepID=A0ABU8HCK2_9BACI